MSMKLDDMIMISVDDHVCEPADMWDNHVPAKWKDRAPKLITQNGADLWTFEGGVMPNIGVNAVAGRVPEEYGMEPTSLSHMRKAAYDIDARIDDMNATGMLASICFASVPGFVGQWYNICKDKELAEVIIKAYNDWHIDEWCGKYPGRFICVGVANLWDAAVCAEENVRNAKRGW